MSERISGAPTLEIETEMGFPRLAMAGVDEVGRGCLAGPVVAGAVVLPASASVSLPEWIGEVRDSKLLTSARREALVPLIEGWVQAHAVAFATVEEIDHLNIFQASLIAMKRAIGKLSPGPEFVLVDGKFIPPGLSVKARAVVKGDLRCLSIACASILAKVWRDQLIVKLAEEYPGYGLEDHKGYATPAHKAALVKLGAAPIHRKTFAPVREAMGGIRHSLDAI